jgi:hypothetical protein
MSLKNCPHFDRILDELLANQQSAIGQRHLAECPSCAAAMDRLQPVVSILLRDSRIENSRQLDPVTLDRLARSTRELARSLEDRRLSRKLGLLSLATLPLVVMVNYLWAALGFSLIASTISTAAASVFLAFFLAGASGISGILYASLPLLAGVIRGRSFEENLR